MLQVAIEVVTLDIICPVFMLKPSHPSPAITRTITLHVANIQQVISKCDGLMVFLPKKRTVQIKKNVSGMNMPFAQET